LERGRWWYFETETTVLDSGVRQRLMIANIGAGTNAGKRVFIQRQSSGREVYFHQTSRGLERRGTRHAFGAAAEAEAATLIMPNDRTIGMSWVTQTQLALIESRTFARQDRLRPQHLPVDLTMSIAATDESVVVPAGTFHRCVRIDGTGKRNVKTDRGNTSAEVVVKHQEWYAPGVGVIRAERWELAESPFLKAGHYVQELVQHD
jgi:hypothetical protein